MNRAMKMLAVLNDGQKHTRRQIFEQAGFMLTNNAASELRALGHDVRQSSERVDGQMVYSYQWVGSLPAPDQGNGRHLNGTGGEPASEPPSVTLTRPKADERSDSSGAESEPEQLRLSEVA